MSPARAVGAVSQDGLPAEERTGVLWDALRALAAQGWEPDTFSYSTAFRHAARAPAQEWRMPCDTGRGFGLLATGWRELLT